ncbi:MAG: hypothetical protein ACHREM_04665 [Polyangiales bacterium]
MLNDEERAQINDVVVFPWVLTGPAYSARASQVLIAVPATLFRGRILMLEAEYVEPPQVPAPIAAPKRSGRATAKKRPAQAATPPPQLSIPSGDALASIVVDEIKIANQSQVLTNSGGIGGPTLLGLAFSRKARPLFLHLDTAQRNNQISIIARNISPHEVRLRGVVLGESIFQRRLEDPTVATPAPVPPAPDQPSDDAPTEASVPHFVSPFVRRPTMRAREQLMPLSPVEIAPGASEELVGCPQQDVTFNRLIVDPAFDVEDVFLGDAYRAPRASMAARPGFLFAADFPFDLPLRLPRAFVNTSVHVRLRNRSSKPKLAYALLHGTAHYD